MGHLNELHEKYKDKGLVVLGVTNEARSAVDDFVENNSAAYPIVIEESDSAKAFGIGGFPSAYLIAPNGRIAAVGNPSPAQIDELLEGARVLPPFPDALSSAEKLLRKEKYAAAHDDVVDEIERGKLEEADQQAAEQIRDWLRWLVESTLAQAATDAEAGNAYEAWAAYTDASKDFKGFVLDEVDVAKDAKAKAKALLGDKDRKKEIDAGKKLARVLDGIHDLSAKKAIKALTPLVGKKYGETKAGQKAAALIADFEKE